MRNPPVRDVAGAGLLGRLWWVAKDGAKPARTGGSGAEPAPMFGGMIPPVFFGNRLKPTTAGALGWLRLG